MLYSTNLHVSVDSKNFLFFFILTGEHFECGGLASALKLEMASVSSPVHTHGINRTEQGSVKQDS